MEDRADVAQALGCRRNIGFQVSLPFAHGPVLIALEQDGALVQINHDLDLDSAKTRAERKLNWKFWGALFPAVPMIVLGLFRRDPDLRRRIKRVLHLGPHVVDALLRPEYLAKLAEGASQQQLPPELAHITVLLPVYNAFSLLPEVLDRLKRHTNLPCHLIIIEDCSPDPLIRPWLRDWTAQHAKRCAGKPEDTGDAQLQVTLLENDTNLGFIASINRGFEHTLNLRETGPIVLLNSDAMLPSDWAKRLVAPLRLSDVASVTPLSNDAEIFGAPAICRPTALRQAQGDHIDSVLRHGIALDAPLVSAPTGVGFCMALARAWVEQVGSFDLCFGRGYGEEVDWCRRAVALGGRHVAAPNLFVEHRGGASFGPEKQTLVQKNNAIIADRYPGYDQLVQDFIRTDPLSTARLLAALAWADSLPDISEIPVFIAHSLGGGAEHYLQAQLAEIPVSVVLRLGGAFRVRIEFDSPAGQLVVNAENMAPVVAMLQNVKRRRIIYSCAVGDPELATLPDTLVRLAEGAPLDILFHDYLPISPSYTLLDSDGVYRGVPSVGMLDPAHVWKASDGAVTTLKDWRSAWAHVVDVADRLVVFSNSSAKIVSEAFPVGQDKIALTPHDLLQPMSALPNPKASTRVIGVLGAIGPQKGAAVVEALARLVRGSEDIELVVIGRIAPGFDLGTHVPIHGPYAIEDIPALAARYSVSHWLIPSVWPETFSYTVHECLATGLPTMAFDLGAQGDAVRSAANGVLLPWGSRNNSPEYLAAEVFAVINS
jgi:GT2 family glycosyltransferase